MEGWHTVPGWSGMVLLQRMLPEVCNFGILFLFFCLATKEPKSQGCKEKISLWLEFQPSSMPSAAG